MNRRFLLIVVLLIASAGTWFLIKLFDIGGSHSGRSLLAAVPANASLVIIMKGTGSIREEMSAYPWWQDLRKFDFVERLDSQLSFLQKFSIQTGLSPGAVAASVHITSSATFDFLYIFAESKKIPENIPGFTPGSHVFSQTEIRSVMTPSGTFSFVVKDGFFLGSFTAFLVEDAVFRLKSGKAGETVFEEGGAGSALSIFINFRNLAALSPVYLSQDKHATASVLGEFAAWMKLDADFEEGYLRFSGTAYSGDSMFHQLDLMRDAPPGDGSITSFIPANAAMALLTHVSSFGKGIGRDTLSLNPFAAIADNEWGFLALESHDDDYTDDLIGLVKVKDTLEARAVLRKMQSDSTAPGDFPVVRPALGAFGSAFLSFTAPRYLIHGNWIVFGSSQQCLNRWKNAIAGGVTLAGSPDYQAFSGKMLSAANKTLYVNTGRLHALLKSFASPSFHNNFPEVFNLLKKFSPAAIQVTAFKDVHLVNAAIAYGSGASGTEVKWTAKMDTTFSGRLQMVKSHTGPAQHIFAQDDGGTLYLISPSGKLLWKKKTGVPVGSRVYEMDYFGNGKLQFLFSAGEEINLLDINGNSVSHFPISLPSKAANGVTLVDYDNRRNYRIFISTVQGSLYGFESSGKPLPGWNPKERPGVISLPVIHFAKDGKDHLVTSDNEGRITFYDRKGEKRGIAGLETKITAMFADTFNAGARIIAFDSAGRVFETFTDGTFRVIAGFPSAQFLASDILADTGLEFAVLHQNSLNVFAHDTVLKYSFEFPEGFAGYQFVVRIPGSLRFNAAAADTAGKLLYLFNDDGSPYEGFPMEGGLGFEITGPVEDAPFLVIVPGRDGSIKAVRTATIAD